MTGNSYLRHYIALAVRSFKRNKLLTLLMVLTLGLGIGSSITTLTVLRLLSGDPLPDKSARLFTPVFNPDPTDTTQPESMPRWWGNLMSYTDAMNVVKANKAERQAAVALTQAKVSSSGRGEHPFFTSAAMVTNAFFPMFQADFRYGTGWNASDDESGAKVAVISASLNNRLFGGSDSTARTLRINDIEYRIIGVLAPWAPQPRFYALSIGGNAYGEGESVFLPLRAARADKMAPENVSCWDSNNASSLEGSPCAWLSVWVELAQPSDAAAYKAFLSNYVHDQVALGRMRDSKFWFYGVMDFLQWQQVVPDDVKLQTNLAFGFLIICVVGTVSLLMAKCLGRSHEIGIRRAMGATRLNIFSQFMTESGAIGLLGGLAGLIFAELGLWFVRHQPVKYAAVAHLDTSMFLTTFIIALSMSLVAGILPAWRACSIAVVPQLNLS